jgi:outer membrane receptor protein involved in Fe transport
VVTSITTRQDSRYHPFTVDPDFSPLTGNTATVHHVQTQWSEDLRVKPADPDEKWDWHAGFFFSTTDTELHRPVDFFVPPLALSGRDDIDSSQNASTYAGFGECTRQVTDKLDVTVGLRLDYTT